MTLPFKYAALALVCSAGLFAASGVLYVKSRTPETPVQTAPVMPQPQTAPIMTPAVKPAFTSAQIDQWVAPVALYPDPLLSQVLMAATYPTNVVQAVQWSRDNPTLQGDAAIQAVSGQPWDPSVKSLVAFPQLMALMGENPEWVQNLGDAFLAQPQEVMGSVQRLRQLAQQTGALKSTPQQTVSSTPKKTEAPPAAVQSSGSAPAPTVIKIEPADPQVVYVPNYNPATVYGSWPNTAYPPVYLPPPPGQQFAESFVKGFGYSLGVATTYALFSNIDWDDDNHHHDDDHHDGGYHGNGYQHNGDNININVNNFNRISGQDLKEQSMTWQHNPAYRDGIPYQNAAVAQRFHTTNVSGGLSATQQPAASRDSQRQAAMAQFEQRNHAPASSVAGVSSRDAQRKAASQQLNQVAQRNNYRGYDSDTPRPAQNAKQRPAKESLQPKQRVTREMHQRNVPASPQREQHLASNRANALSGNDSRSPSWQSQQQRGQQSRRINSGNLQPRGTEREGQSEHREFRRR